MRNIKQHKRNKIANTFNYSKNNNRILQKPQVRPSSYSTNFNYAYIIFPL